MLKTYQVIYTTYFNDKIISQQDGGLAIEEEGKIENVKKQINWDSLSEFYSNPFRGFWVDFYGKKGRAICINSNSFWGYSIIAKEWKDKDLNLSFARFYKETTPSIKEILEYYDSNVAIQYLKERGLMLNAGTGDFTV